MTFAVELAKCLEANGAPGTVEQHRIAVAKLHAEMTNSGGSALADAVLGYIANHHTFDLDSMEKVRLISLVVFELCHPLAKDDHRSEAALKHLTAALPRRLSEL